jgi:hypothetical protein
LVLLGVGVLSAIPSAERFVDPAVGVTLLLWTCHLCFHSAHSGTKGSPPLFVCLGFGVGGRWLKVAASSFIVAGPALCIKSPLGVLPFFSCPSGTHFFLAVLAELRKSLAVGRPFSPALFMRSLEPPLMRSCLALMFAYNPFFITGSVRIVVRFSVCQS